MDCANIDYDEINTYSTVKRTPDLLHHITMHVKPTPERKIEKKSR